MSQKDLQSSGVAEAKANLEKQKSTLKELISPSEKRKALHDAITKRMDKVNEHLNERPEVKPIPQAPVETYTPPEVTEQPTVELPEEENQVAREFVLFSQNIKNEKTKEDINFNVSTGELSSKQDKFIKQLQSLLKTQKENEKADKERKEEEKRFNERNGLETE